MEGLQHLVYGTNRDNVGDAILAEQFIEHLKIFPHGQYIAVDESHHDRVVGLTVSMRVQFDPKRPQSLIEPWRITTNDAWLTTHQPNGNWLYGAESAVHPAYRGYGIGRALMEARWHVVRRLNLQGMVAGGTLKNYHRYAQRMSPEAYVRAVERGELFCTNLTKQFKMGFKAIAIIPNYVDDPDTLGYAAMIVWHNPDFHPERTPQRIYRRRYIVELQQRRHVVHGHAGHAGNADASAGV
jgi:GNAT superfamily N-acetyltransferase